MRVGVLLPFSNGSGQTRALAAAMMKAAELALFDAHNPNILLMAGDEGSTPAQAAAAARDLLEQGGGDHRRAAVLAIGVGGGAHRARPRRVR